MEKEHTNICEALLDRCAGRSMAPQPRIPGGDVVCDGGSKQRLLVGEPAIDGRLSRAGGLGDLFNARALKAAIEKDFAGRIEDALLNLARVFLGGAAGPHVAARHGSLSRFSSRCHFIHLVFAIGPGMPVELSVRIKASLLAYVDVFWTLMLISLAAVPLALLLRKVKLGGPAPVAH